MQMFKKPGIWAYSALAVVLWAFFAFAMPDVLEFWEKNQLFRFTSEYWHFFDHEPFGTLIYLNTFLIQFSYYTWLGAIVYSLLFILTAFLFNRCLKTDSSTWLLPGLVCACLLLPSTVNFGLLMPLMACLAFAGAQVWIFQKKAAPRYILQVAVLAVLTWLLREYIVWVCLLYISLDVYHARRQAKKINLLFWLPALCATVLAFGTGIWFSRPYDFVYADLLFSFAAHTFSPTASIPYAYFGPEKPVLICLFVFAALTLASAFYIKPKSKTWIAWILGVLPIAAGFSQTSYRNIKDFQKVDRLCRNYQWNEALKELDRQWEKRNFSANTHEDYLFAGQTKLALLATRKATSRLFTYPQPLFPLLFPLDMVNRAECILLPTYYTFVGGFAESLHLDYDQITGHAISANVLNRLIRTSLIMDDTLPASKLNHFLEKSLFYRKQAAIYRDADARSELPEIKRGKGMLPNHNYTVAGYQPDMDARRQHLAQPENPYFYEYYLCVCLLNKEYGRIAEEMPNIRKFYPKENAFTAPRHLQEAVLANFDYNPSRFMYPSRIEGVGSEVWNDYWRFIFDNQSYLNGQMRFAELQKKWGHTYWFYDCYLKIISNQESLHSIN